jgi:hypothetical protein
VASIAVSSALDSTEASSGRASASTEASLDRVSPSIVASSVPALAFSGRASLSGQASSGHPLGGGRRRRLGGGHRRRRGGGGGLAPGEGRPDKGISQEQLTRTSWRGPQPMKPSMRTCLNETSRPSDIAKDRDVHTGLRAIVGSDGGSPSHTNPMISVGIRRNSGNGMSLSACRRVATNRTAMGRRPSSAQWSRHLPGRRFGLLLVLGSQTREKGNDIRARRVHQDGFRAGFDAIHLRHCRGHHCPEL